MGSVQRASATRNEEQRQRDRAPCNGPPRRGTRSGGKQAAPQPTCRPSRASSCVWRSAPCGHLDVAAEHAARAQHLGVGSHRLPARLDQRWVERSVLAGGGRQVPAVDEHVEQPVAGVGRPGDRSVRDGYRRVHRPGRGEGPVGRGGRRPIGPERIVAEHVTVEGVADVGDRAAGRQLDHPVVAGDDVVEQLAHVPAVAGRRVGPLSGADAGDEPFGAAQGTAVQVQDVVHQPSSGSPARLSAADTSLPPIAFRCIDSDRAGAGSAGRDAYRRATHRRECLDLADAASSGAPDRRASP